MPLADNATPEEIELALRRLHKQRERSRAAYFRNHEVNKERQLAYYYAHHEERKTKNREAARLRVAREKAKLEADQIAANKKPDTE